MSEEAPKTGWGWPLASKKAHYFHGMRSLCGSWLYAGKLEEGKDASPDNCPRCVKLLNKHRSKEAKP